jgi:hypothetical protein
VARLREPAGVERLKPVVNQVTNLGAAARPVILDGLAGEVVLRTLRWRTGCTVGHRRASIAPLIQTLQKLGGSAEKP